MSISSINQYYNNVDQAVKFGKSTNEQSVRNFFWMLLNDYAQKQHYLVIPELPVMGNLGKKVYPDGTIKNNWGLDVGYWESKDEKDIIDDEINSKIAKGYPLINILFEDTNVAVLYQRGTEVQRVNVRDAQALDSILTKFFTFKSETVYQFETAIQKFKADIPIIVETLRNKIEDYKLNNEKFQQAQEIFWELCKVEINPSITLDDIREMMIQHILTSDIFNKIFDDPEFHRHNTIASELENLVGTLFTYAERKNLLHSIDHYYLAINATAAAITDHHEKQKFLKVLYENFYKVYNPKAADRLGVVYTPNEIVQFMVKSTDYLLHKHFGKTLADKNVEILDIATGTGTFICEIIENAIPKHQLEYKYKNEIYANEVAILPYYVANLNIEFTYKQKMDSYAEFPNLCFVDTLDNVGGLDFKGQQKGIFGLSHENSDRINRQNSKKISVIISNPPYNANQLNENENNKNREYPVIDKRIKETFIKESTAQKTKMYDMYSRFYRWAMDRIGDEGIIAFITNRSFINSRTFDGFRKIIQEEFDFSYIVDLGGDLRAQTDNDTANVFGIKVGVSIMFLIKKPKSKADCFINYYRVKGKTKENKFEWLHANQGEQFNNIPFEHIQPDKNHNWIDLSQENDWEKFLLTIDKANKFSKVLKNDEVLFKLYSYGVVTNRDEWVYDFNKDNLFNKIDFFYSEYSKVLGLWIIENKEKSYKLSSNDFYIKKAAEFVFSKNTQIKWSGRLFRDKLLKQRKFEFKPEFIQKSIYRPYSLQYFYFDYLPIDNSGQQKEIFPDLTKDNKVIFFNGPNIKEWNVLSSNKIVDLNLFYGGSQCLPLYRYENGNRVDNITDWGLEKFRERYGELTKEDIFHYVYAVLHNPEYRKKYELNLKREFPRIPFYDDFWKWANWGKQLMVLHINFEEVEPYQLNRIDFPIEHDRKLKVKLKADRLTGIIELDEKTTLSGIPKTAWDYKLGNRSALEWILDQYKEKKPSDPTIAEKFNTYQFADYKEKVIDLLQRVCTVSVKTMEIIGEIR